MSETNFYNIYFGLLIFCVVGILMVAVYSRKRLFKYGEKVKGLIIEWKQDIVGNSSTSDVESISTPVVSFTTKQGVEVTGLAITGFSDSEEPVNIYVDVYYDPADPTKFVVKFQKSVVIKRNSSLDIYKKNIPVNINGEVVMVSLKWYRGANRWNNGATRYGRKYLLRLIIGRSKANNRSAF